MFRKIQIKQVSKNIRDAILTACNNTKLNDMAISILKNSRGQAHKMLHTLRLLLKVNQIFFLNLRKYITAASLSKIYIYTKKKIYKNFINLYDFLSISNK